MSDEYDPDAEASAYSDDEHAYGADPDLAPAPAAPRPAAEPRARRRSLSGLGDFSPEGACTVTALAKLLWRFFTQVTDGNTQDALVTLSVYRSLYNMKRAVVAAGFSAAAQGQLPVTIPDTSWSQPMMASAVLLLLGAYGPTDTAVVNVLRTMPLNMAALATWFPNLRNATTPEEATALRAYSDAPMPVGDPNPARILAAYVVDDLHACNPAAAAPPIPTPSAPAPTPAPFVAVPQAPQPVTMAPLRPQQTPSQNPQTSSGGQQREGGMGLWGLALLALAGYGAWLAYQDHQKVMAERKHGVAGLDEEDQ